MFETGRRQEKGEITPYSFADGLDINIQTQRDLD